MVQQPNERFQKRHKYLYMTTCQKQFAHSDRTVRISQCEV
jgi:hypothetical protein